MKESRSLPSTKLSEAHQRSRFAIMDPSCSTQSFNSLVVPEFTWLYGEAELECWRLQVLQNRIKKAELKVHYPGTYHVPWNTVYFRLSLSQFSHDVNLISFQSNSCVSVSIDNKIIYKSEWHDTTHEIPFFNSQNAQYIIIEMESPGQDPPCLSIQEGEAATESAPWEWSCDGKLWSIPRGFTSLSERQYPHCSEHPEMILSPLKKEGNVYDFGCEILGKIQITSQQKPKIFVGESVAEAINRDEEKMEQSTEIEEIEEDSWQSCHLLAFRYLTIDGLTEEPMSITCSSPYHPVRYQGAFASSDETLTRIWMTSAYTLHLCMHDFFIDGIKRDRLPWTGDLAVSLLANAYSFKDAELVRRSLTVLGRSGIRESHINGIIDYSLWWVIVHDLFQLYYSDIDYLQREWQRIEDCITTLLTQCNSDVFLQSENSWLFIDWVDVEKFTALQVLWWWALDSGIILANRLGEVKAASQWLKNKNLLQTNLKESAWDSSMKLWRSSCKPTAEYSRHANILSVISGLTNISDGTEIKQSLLENKFSEVGTPYMKGFECLALSSLGAETDALQILSSYWGGMIGEGATTFWEAYDPSEIERESYAFYNRPYARSLCHAWGAGPCSLLPRIILGIQPLSDGWKEWTCSPNPGELEWVCATVPIPGGETAEVKISKSTINITVPSGTTLVTEAGRFPGPARLKANRTDHLFLQRINYTIDRS